MNGIDSGTGTDVAMVEDPFTVLKLEFLNGMGESLDALEGHILALENPPSRSGNAQAIVRLVHSVKGAGGSYEMPLISQVCHQLEDELRGLTTACEKGAPVLVEPFLKYLDLLRKVCGAYRSEAHGVLEASVLEALEDQLAALRSPDILRCLLVDPSRTTHRLVTSALANLPVVTSWCTDGYAALGRVTQRGVDLLITSKSVPTIDGMELLACIASLNLKDPPRTVLLTSGGALEPRLGIRPDSILFRDGKLVDDLQALVRNVIEQQARGTSLAR